ncbi:c-type cytochrome [bacterium]|nr:c-type cytochrome [bacterium]
MKADWSKTLGVALGGILLVAGAAQAQQLKIKPEWGLRPLPAVKAPASNPTTPAKIELGKMLFFDPRISGDGSLSCASCHLPSKGWADGRPTGSGFKGKVLARNTPSVINSAHYKTQFWDGRAPSLEEQAKGPLFNPDEMNSTPEKVVKALSGIPEYRKRFKQVFGGEPTVDRTAAAIAAFERTIVSGPSAFDRYLKGDKKALSASARRGFRVFTRDADCIACHKGPNFTDDNFYNIGVPGSGDKDKGRYAISRDRKDMGAFKTTGLRDVALTAPYMHDGSMKTLRDAVKHYEKVEESYPNLSDKIKRWGMTSDDIDDVVEFLKALSGPPIKVTPPKLPS